MRKILIVDDDPSIGDMLAEALRREGFEPLRAYSGTEARLLLERTRPELVLLDLMLPGLSGEELLPKLAGIPVIVVSAKGAPRDKAELLRAGAADYVSKPFDLDELLARIEARLRAPADAGETLRAAELTLDTVSHELRVGGTPVRLTRTEYAILKLLMRNPGQVIARSVLLDRIGEDTPDGGESSLKVHVSNLRRKLRDAGGRDRIEAVWGIGFRLDAGERDES